MAATPGTGRARPAPTSTARAPIRVTRIGWGSLPEVARAFPDRPISLHEDRLRDQDVGLLVYLIARRGGEAAGHVMVRFAGNRDWDPFQDRFGCAEVGDLWVAPRHRRRGVARALMRAAEARALAAGDPRIGLATGLDEGYAAARSLYDALGYRRVTGWYVDTWRTPDPRGGWRPDGEILLGFYVKHLTPRSDGAHP